MSIGAVFAAMNTMYASVGSRTREIGTLRVLGFRRRTILAGFFIEGAFLALIGGVLGCLLALAMQWPHRRHDEYLKLLVKQFSNFASRPGSR